MKSYKIILALGISALTLASCADKAFINGVLADAPGKEIVLKKLNINTYNVLDTVKTKADGAFSYSLKMEKGQPEFVYVFYGDKRIAGLLLEAGEKVQVKADTLGRYETSGSEGSALLAEVDAAQAAFAAKLEAATDDKDINKAFIERYRDALKFIMSNQKSLSVIPVLFENIVDGLPLFNKPTDAIMFRSTLDSLKTVYPKSGYVKALERETSRRETGLVVDSKIKTADALGYPDIVLPDFNGKKVALSSLNGNKAILVLFWTSEDPTHSFINSDALLPIYNDFHSQGFEIYSVGVDVDKARWGSMVSAQKLPWINVNDGLGTYSPAVASFNVTEIPTSFLIVDGEIVESAGIQNPDEFRKELGKLLRQ